MFCVFYSLIENKQYINTNYKYKFQKQYFTRSWWRQLLFLLFSLLLTVVVALQTVLTIYLRFI